MAGTKRPREDGGNSNKDAEAQPPAKRRFEYSEAAAERTKIYDSLADEIEAVRAKAAEDLIRSLWEKSPDRSQRLDTAIKRLVKGLCSGRKAARLGFSVPLPEILRLKFSAASTDDGDATKVDLRTVVNDVIVWTRPEGNVKGPEKRDHMHGRRFAFQAILQSDVALNKDLPAEQWQHFVEAAFELANQKQWVRRDVGAMFHNYLLSPSGSKLSDERVQVILQVLIESKQVKTPEGVGLWITIASNFPNVSLPKGIWHHKDPLSSKERVMLGKAMLENAQDDDADVKKGGQRQSIPSFAWAVVMNALYDRKEGKDFPKFWDEVVAGAMFSPNASPERKSLGLQIFSLAVATAPLEHLLHIVHPSILRTIIDQRSNKNGYLFEATKVPLNKMVARAKEQPASSPRLIRALLTQGMPYLDQILKLKTIENIISSADDNSLWEINVIVYERILDPETQQTAQAETRRRILADLLLTMARSHKESSNAKNQSSDDKNVHSSPPAQWLKNVLSSLTNVSYSRATEFNSITPKSRAVFQARLMSCLNVILEGGLVRGVWAPIHVVQSLNDIEKEDGIQVPESLQEAKKSLKKASKSKNHAFELLLSLSILQVYNEEADAVGVLDDAVACFKGKVGDDDSSTTLIELLLSFVSKPSALFRKLAEQVFAAVAPQMNADSLQSLLDILEQKESFKGQQELFDQNGEDEDMDDVGDSDESDDDENSDDDFENVEDASDLELSHGNIVSGSESDSDSASGDEDDSSSEINGLNGTTNLAGEDEDEEAAFDRKLAEALRTSGANATEGDDSSDESSMDDEQMLALEPALATIFSERRKQSSKKQENKDAKEQIVNFKNRVLDLLTLYVKSESANPLALDLLLPLVTLTRTTGSKQTAEKAFAVLKTYFDAASKNKMFPVSTDVEALVELLGNLHNEMKRPGTSTGTGAGGVKLHMTACSRASLFVSKVLVAKDLKLFDRVVDAYANLLKEWFAESSNKSGVAQNVFTEWMSWSIEVRRSL